MLSIVIDNRYRLNGIANPEEFGITLQELNLSSFTQRGGTFSTEIELERTSANTKALGLTTLSDSADRIYRLFPATIMADNFAMFQGQFRVTRVAESRIYGRVFAEGSAMAKLTGLKLEDLDLSSYDHVWTAANVHSRRNNSTGVVYPNINYGRWTNEAIGNRPHTDFFPAVHADAIMEAIAAELNLNYVDSGLDRIIPFSRQKFSQRKSLNNTRIEITSDETRNFSGTGAYYRYDAVVASDPKSIFDSSSDGLDPGAGEIKARIKYRIKGSCSSSPSGTGGVLTIEGPGNSAVVTQFMGDGDSVDVEGETEISGEFVTATGQGLFGSIGFTGVRSAGNSADVLDITLEQGSYIEIISAERQILDGDEIPVAETLPDMTVLEFIKHFTSTQFRLLKLTSTEMELVKLNDLITGLHQAQDYTSKAVNRAQRQMEFEAGDYGKKNIIAYKEREGDDPTAREGQRDQGVLGLQAEWLEEEKDLYESPFADTAETLALKDVTTQGGIILPLIPRYSETTLAYNEPDLDPGPRILKPIFDDSAIIDITGQTSAATQCNPEHVAMQADVDDFGKELTRILNVCEVVEQDFWLTNYDVARLDLFKLIYVEGGYFLILEIRQYKPASKGVTTVRMIKV